MTMISVADSRWPGVLDADDLRKQIQELSRRHDVSDIFYSQVRQQHLCQGDVVEFSSKIPLLDRSGEPATARSKTGLWLVIGNTCDFTRDLEDCEWTQVVPVVDLAEGGVKPPNETALRAYQTSRLFFVPPWSSDRQGALLAADFTRPVHIHKQAFRGNGIRAVATMNQASWVLLNACLVRFCARDDGRFSRD